MSNRHSRRREAKLARNAQPDEIFPDDKHGPAQPETAAVMETLLDFVRTTLPGWGITIFLNERDVPAGESRLPRFNYGSTENRADMYAVLQAFLLKNAALAPKLDRIDDPSPSGSKN